MLDRIGVAEGYVAMAQEDSELVAHLSVCCGIVLSDYKWHTAFGHALRPESDWDIMCPGIFGDYITPRESIDALLKLFGGNGIGRDDLRAHLFGCTGSTIAQATAEEARELLSTYKIPIATQITGLGAMRLRVTPEQAVIEFLDSAGPIRIDLHTPK